MIDLIYLSTNGEASLSRIITSSIGASYKTSTSPPSPHTKLERNKPKPKRQEDVRKNTKNLQSIYRDRIAKVSTTPPAPRLTLVIRALRRPTWKNSLRKHPMILPKHKACENRECIAMTRTWITQLFWHQMLRRICAPDQRAPAIIE